MILEVVIELCCHLRSAYMCVPTSFIYQCLKPFFPQAADQSSRADLCRRSASAKDMFSALETLTPYLSRSSQESHLCFQRKTFIGYRFGHATLAHACPQHIFTWAPMVSANSSFIWANMTYIQHILLRCFTAIGSCGTVQPSIRSFKNCSCAEDFQAALHFRRMA